MRAPACRRLLVRGVVVALLGGYAGGCATPAVEVGLDAPEGEAALAALEHVAAFKWEQEGAFTVKGKAAVEYRGEKPLSAATRGFLDEAFEARGWWWSTGDPLTEPCGFPIGDCRLKDPTELHLTFSVERLTGQEGYAVNVEWLSSFPWRGRDRAELGGHEVWVTRGAEGWVTAVYTTWIT